MKWVALMPLRAGSKSIPDKNVKNIAGRPLFSWSLGAAVHSECFDEIYVASDSARIREIVAAAFPAGVQVIDRSPETASDTATTESAMLEFQRRVSFDVLCLIQATSPLTRAVDFVAAKEQFIAESLDSLLTAVRSNRFVWNAQAEALNYTPATRPRHQDFEGSYVENGAFYLTAAQVLKRDACRLGGDIGIHVMPAETVHELDDERDWGLIEQALSQRAADEQLSERLRRVKLMVLDVDGTLTDGIMVYGPQGEVLKNFHTRDGKGLERLASIGVRVCVMTGEDSPTTAARMAKLGIEDYYPGVENKLAVLEKQLAAWRINLDEVAFIGDDLGDLESMTRAGISFCPADAVARIQAAADYACSRRGGEGAVREVCDLIYAAHGEE